MRQGPVGPGELQSRRLPSIPGKLYLQGGGARGGRRREVGSGDGASSCARVRKSLEPRSGWEARGVQMENSSFSTPRLIIPKDRMKSESLTGVRGAAVD